MKLVMEYKCDNRVPTDDEIREGIEIANTNDCIVRLTWFFPYSGWYKLLITKGMTFEECQEKLPKVYGV
jgi:hypothetical protein